jgi:Fe2+ transport system protein FeoA
MTNALGLPETHADARMDLESIRPGGVVAVARVEAGGALRRRILEMGFVPGTLVRVVRYAPLGDPMEFVLHGYHISLRRSEARAILVRPV